MPLVLTLDKSLSLLEAVISHSEGIGTRALALELSLNVATAHNISRTFCHRGYLRQDPDTKEFFPGIRLMLLGKQHLSSFHSFGLSVGPIIDEVAKKLNESVMLAAINQGHILNLKYVPCRQALRVHEADDISAHAHCTAVGKVLLASLPKVELDTHLQRTSFQPFTPNTIVAADLFRAELAKIASQGYGRTRDEASIGVSAVAVPVRDPWGTVVAGIGASAPTIRLKDQAQFDRTLHELRNAALRVEQHWKDSRQAAPSGKTGPRRGRRPKV